jgi:hypothetical protein
MIRMCAVHLTIWLNARYIYVYLCYRITEDNSHAVIIRVLSDHLTYTTVQQVSLYSEQQSLASFIIYSLVAIHSEGRTC